MMNESRNLIDKDKLEFAVFCIESLATAADCEPQRVYRVLADESNILNQYIIPEYEMLHTQSKEYIISEIMDVMRDREVSL